MVTTWSSTKMWQIDLVCTRSIRSSLPYPSDHFDHLVDLKFSVAYENAHSPLHPQPALLVELIRISVQIESRFNLTRHVMMVHGSWKNKHYLLDPIEQTK